MRASKKVKRVARELFRLCRASGAFDEGRARQIAGALARSPRRGALRVLADFQRLVRLEYEQHTAVIESAAPLTGQLRQDIEAGLTRTYGDTLEMSFGENPALIGGIRIKVGSDVYDGSIRARLAALESKW